MAEANTIHDVLAILIPMIDEAQVEATHCLHASDWRVMVAKRDALTELKMRLRGERVDPYWARRVPPAAR